MKKLTRNEIIALILAIALIFIAPAVPGWLSKKQKPLAKDATCWRMFGPTNEITSPTFLDKINRSFESNVITPSNYKFEKDIWDPNGKRYSRFNYYYGRFHKYACPPSLKEIKPYTGTM